MALTTEQTRELQGAIENRRAALVHELHDDLARMRRDRLEELAGPGPDAGDESVAALIADLDQADAGRDLAELRELESARQRIDDGSYGSCQDCGGDIGFERLRANPAAVRCIGCQTLYEKLFVNAKGSSL